MPQRHGDGKCFIIGCSRGHGDHGVCLCKRVKTNLSIKLTSGGGVELGGVGFDLKFIMDPT